jgi:hypothetical protein
MVKGFLVGIAIAGWDLFLSGPVPRPLWWIAGFPGVFFVASLFVCLIWLTLLSVASSRAQSVRAAIVALLEALSDGVRTGAASLFSICLLMAGATFFSVEDHILTVLLSGWLCTCLALCSYSIDALVEGIIDYNFGCS